MTRNELADKLDTMVVAMYEYLRFRTWNADNLRAALEAALGAKENSRDAE